MSGSSPAGRVLVTGATGFLGAHLVARLQRDSRLITAVSRQPRPNLVSSGVHVVVGTLDRAEVCAAAVAGVETVFHVAARVGVWGRYGDFYRDNVVATETLLQAARQAGVKRFVFTSTPSVVYNGQDLSGADESLPLTQSCPSPYPLTKALAERAVLAANSAAFRTVALRPHLIWGPGDPHLVPRVLARARAGRLRKIGRGENRVDLVHIHNAVEAHVAAERALQDDSRSGTLPPAAGRAYFITNGEPVRLWEWINGWLTAIGERPVTRSIPLGVARTAGALAELTWRCLPLKGEPPITRFIADELAKDHWFSIAAARRDLGYTPAVTMADGTAALITELRASASRRAR